MKLSVNGLGLVSKIGDQQALAGLLAQDQILFNQLPPGNNVALDIGEDTAISPAFMRRMGHLAKMALISAERALEDSGLEVAGKSIGIIQGSVYGPIVAGIQALDELMDFGDNQLSPTQFSGSVFNISATYLSLAFGIQGRTLSHTGGLDTLYHSLLTASLWLDSGEADYVLLGVGDEYTPYFKPARMTEALKGSLPTCEGWTTFILSNDRQTAYGALEYGLRSTLPRTEHGKNIYSLWNHHLKMTPFSTHAGVNQACFPENLRGAYPGGTAFDLALALICAKNKRFPVSDTLQGCYRVQQVSEGEIIRCYGMTEHHGVVFYHVV